jgi:hypothetical protein
MTLVALAGIAAHSAGASAADTASSMFSFNAFGTVGIVHSNQDQADFVGNVFQPDGAGYTHTWDMGPDTKLAGQVQAKFTDRFSAILQVVVQHQYDDTYTPQVEWANIKFAVTDDIDIRAGRVVLPAFLISESRYVGYANPWLRPPQEVYTLNSITSNDGGDVTYRSKLGNASNTAQVFYGSSTAKLAFDNEMKAKYSWGVNDSLAVGDLTLRVGFVSQELDMTVRTIAPLFNGLRTLGNNLTAFGFQPAGAKALAMAEKYKLDGMAFDNYTAGASYDPGKWFVMAEGAITKSEGLISDAKSWYVTGGYRIAKFTPYLTYGDTKSDVIVEPGIPTTGLPGAFAAGASALNAAVNNAQYQFASTQTTSSLGIRWDFMSSADLKVQYDHVDTGELSHGRFINIQPGFHNGDAGDVISIAVDFVF